MNQLEAFIVVPCIFDIFEVRDRSQSERDFPPVQTGPGAHPASCKMGTWSFPGVKCGRGVLLTTHPLLVGHTGPVTGSLYFYLTEYSIMQTGSPNYEHKTHFHLKEFRLFTHFKRHNPHRKTGRQYTSQLHSASAVYTNFNTAMKYYQQLLPQRGEWPVSAMTHFI